MATILVVDDELGIRALLSEILSDEGHQVELAENAAQARAFREKIRPDLVLLDIWMPDVDGISLLKEWNASGQLTMPVIMMSGHGTIDTAVEATKFGAQSFLEKPITLQKLLRSVEQGLSKPPTKPLHDLAPVRAESASLAEPHGVMHAVAAIAGGSTKGGLQSEKMFSLDRPLREARDAFEKSYFEFHLAQENFSMTRVAEKTGLERTHLYRKLKQLGVDLNRTKRSA
jgi:DNA-binding NtrC family response regulator